LSAEDLPVKEIIATEVDLTEGPPKLISPANGTTLTNYTRITTLRWEALLGVSGYRVEVQIQMGSTWSAFQDVTVTGTSYTFTFSGDNWGRWRVSAISGGGVQAPPSGWWRFLYNTH